MLIAANALSPKDIKKRESFREAIWTLWTIPRPWKQICSGCRGCRGWALFHRKSLSRRLAQAMALESQAMAYSWQSEMTQSITKPVMQGARLENHQIAPVFFYGSIILKPSWQSGTHWCHQETPEDLTSLKKKITLDISRAAQHAVHLAKEWSLSSIPGNPPNL